MSNASRRPSRCAQHDLSALHLNEVTRCDGLAKATDSWRSGLGGLHGSSGRAFELAIVGKARGVLTTTGRFDDKVRQQTLWELPLPTNN